MRKIGVRTITDSLTIADGSIDQADENIEKSAIGRDIRKPPFSADIDNFNSVSALLIR